jgi:1,4-dihydroxy-2-naphthoyl-CoA hydrolase
MSTDPNGPVADHQRVGRRETARAPSAPLDAPPLLPGSFLEALGLRIESITGSGLDCVVRGHFDVDERHHTPWGLVHGGVWTSAVETAASLGASSVVADRGQFAVGVDNLTDFLRPVRSGRIEVVARPEQVGRALQLWQVQLTNADGKLVARGRVRLANQDLAE